MEGREQDLATSGSDDRLSRTLAVINGKGGVGKCLTGDAVVIDPVSGVPRRLDEAVGDPSFRFVHSMRQGSGRIATAAVEAQVDSGTKPTLKLTTATGRSVMVTHHHPVLLPDGWRRADQVAVGETLAVPARTPEPLMPVPLEAELVDLLAVLVAEGNTTTPTTKFSTTDPGVLRLASRGAERLGCTVKPASRTSTCDYVLTGGYQSQCPRVSALAGAGPAPAWRPLGRTSSPATSWASPCATPLAGTAAP